MHGDPWTKEADQELRQWFANGRSNKELAKLTGRTVPAIEKRKHLLGIHGGSDKCLRCGIPIEQGGPHRPAYYCGQVCARWDRYEKETGHKPLVEIKGVCAHCGQPFARTVRTVGHEQGQSGLAAYCSRDCDKAAWYLRVKNDEDRRRRNTESAKRYYQRNRVRILARQRESRV